MVNFFVYGFKIGNFEIFYIFFKLRYLDCKFFNLIKKRYLECLSFLFRLKSCFLISIMD